MVTMQSPKPLLLYQCLLHVNPVGRLWSACHIHHYPIFRKMDLQICNVSFSFCRSRIKKQLAKNQRTWSLMDLHMKTVQCRSKKVDYIHWYWLNYTNPNIWQLRENILTLTLPIAILLRFHCFRKHCKVL